MGIWLIAAGALPLVNLNVPFGREVLSVIAVVAGILILMDR